MGEEEQSYPGGQRRAEGVGRMGVLLLRLP